MTLILVPISILCLIFTIAMFYGIRKARSQRTMITRNLAVCLAVGNLLVLLVLDKTYFNLSQVGLTLHKSMYIDLSENYIYTGFVRCFGNSYPLQFSCCFWVDGSSRDIFVPHGGRYLQREKLLLNVQTAFVRRTFSDYCNHYDGWLLVRG